MESPSPIHPAHVLHESGHEPVASGRPSYSDIDSLVPVAIADLNGQVITANAAFLSLYGYQYPSEVAGLPATSFAAIPDFATHAVDAVRAEGKWSGEARARHRDGSTFLVLVSAVLALRDGDPVIVVSMVDLSVYERDARKLRRVNRALLARSGCHTAWATARADSEYLSLLCHVLVHEAGYKMAWIGLVDGSRPSMVTQAASAGTDAGYLRDLQITCDDTDNGLGPTGTAIRTGQPCINRNTKTTAAYQPWRSAALERGYSSSMALPLVRASGVVGAVNIYADEPDAFDSTECDLLAELASDLGRALDMAQVARAREESQIALARSEERFRQLVENATDIVTVIDADGIIQFISPSAERSLGFVPAAMVGHCVFEWIHPGDKIRCAEAIAHALDALQETPEVEYRFRDASGGWRRFESRGRRLPDDQGQIRIVVNSRDVTEHRSLEAQLIQAQKMEALGQLSGGVAHDFNNLLTVIQGHVSLVEPEIQEPLHKESMGEIRMAAERAAQLTSQLLTFSRRRVIQPRDLDINEVVASMTRMLHRLVGEDIAISVAYDPRPLWVNADPGMMEQILLNLAVNARDAMPTGGRLDIETALVEETTATGESVGREVRLTVRDTGCGIPEHVRARIFEPFFTTKDVGKGTGLGLATVHSIVSQHHGRIDVASEVGRGTVFTVGLPFVADAHCGLPVPPAIREVRGGTEGILLVEDEAGVRAFVRRTLAKLGYTVYEASDGLKALSEFARVRGVRLLLTDLVMPDGMSGLDLAKRLLEKQPDLKVVFMSGYNAGTGVGALLDDGANFLQKPFDLRTLSATIRSALDARVS